MNRKYSINGSSSSALATSILNIILKIYESDNKGSPAVISKKIYNTLSFSQ